MTAAFKNSVVSLQNLDGNDEVKRKSQKFPSPSTSPSDLCIKQTKKKKKKRNGQED